MLLHHGHAAVFVPPRSQCHPTTPEPAPDAALRPLAQAQFIFEQVAGRHRCLVRARHNLMSNLCDFQNFQFQ